VILECVRPRCSLLTQLRLQYVIVELTSKCLTNNPQAFTGDHLVDTGTIKVAGFDVRTHLTAVQSKIGYVPQFDALLGLVLKLRRGQQGVCIDGQKLLFGGFLGT
jgi:hypothetical protein